MKRTVKAPSELDNLLMALAQLSFEKHGWDITWVKETKQRLAKMVSSKNRPAFEDYWYQMTSGLRVNF